MEIKNLVILGRSAPEPIKDGRHTVCLAGWWLNKDQFVRIYPTKMNSDVRRWDIINVPVVHDRSHDPRQESYKIEGSKKEWNVLEQKIEKVGRYNRKQRLHLLANIPKTCTVSLNDNNDSLGLIKPTKINAYLEKNGSDSRVIDERIYSKNDYPYKLRLRYQHNNCSLKGDYHDQHCIEWGIYRFWDKCEGEEYDKVINNLQLSNNNYTKYFLIGNQRYRFNSFLVISVLRFKQDYRDGGFFNN